MSSAPVSEDDALSAPAVATGTTLIRARLGFPCIASHEDGWGAHIQRVEGTRIVTLFVTHMGVFTMLANNLGTNLLDLLFC